MLGRLETDRLLVVRGNHEHDNWLEFRQAWNSKRPALQPLHAVSISMGAMSCVGFPCLMGDETVFVSACLADGGFPGGIGGTGFQCATGPVARRGLW